jgi:hypothetical protein
MRGRRHQNLCDVRTYFLVGKLLIAAYASLIPAVVVSSRPSDAPEARAVTIDEVKRSMAKLSLAGLSDERQIASAECARPQPFGTKIVGVVARYSPVLWLILPQELASLAGIAASRV